MFARITLIVNQRLFTSVVCVWQEVHIMENGDVSRAGLKWLGAAG